VLSIEHLKAVQFCAAFLLTGYRWRVCDERIDPSWCSPLQHDPWTKPLAGPFPSLCRSSGARGSQFPHPYCAVARQSTRSAAQGKFSQIKDNGLAVSPIPPWWVCQSSGFILTLEARLLPWVTRRPSLNAGMFCPRQRSGLAFGRSQSGWIGDSRAALWPAVLHCCVSEGICSAKCLKRRVSCWTPKGRFTFLNRHIVLFRKSISIFGPMQ